MSLGTTAKNKDPLSNYNINFSVFSANIDIQKLKISLAKFVKTIKIDKIDKEVKGNIAGKEGFTEVYYRTNDKIHWINPPIKIKQGYYCNSCGAHGPKSHNNDCPDPENNEFLTIGGIIDMCSQFNDRFYIEDGYIYAKDEDIGGAEGPGGPGGHNSGKKIVNKKITEVDRNIQTSYTVQKTVGKYKIKNKIVLKYNFENGRSNEIYITENKITMLSNPVNNSLFYEKLFKHLGLDLRIIKKIHINSIFSNTSFGPIILKPTEIVNNMVNNSIFNLDYSDFLISNKNDKVIIKMFRTMENTNLAGFTVQFYSNSIQVTLSQFVDENFETDIETQLANGKDLIYSFSEAITDLIKSNNLYDIAEKRKLDIKYNTINNSLPYAKSKITNVGSLKKGVEKLDVLLYDNDNETWFKDRFKISKFINKNTVEIVDKTNGSKKIVNINSIKVLDSKEKTDKNGNVIEVENKNNQVCRDLHNGHKYHPVPYSFYGFCPEYNQLITIPGIQSKDDNHFYPCCQELDKDKLYEKTMDFTMNGINQEDRINGLLEDDEFDKFSGLFKKDVFTGYFDIKDPNQEVEEVEEVEGQGQGQKYIKVKLIEILTKVDDKFVVEDLEGNVYRINFNKIHLKYRENRNFNGLNNMFNNKEDQTKFLVKTFIKNGIIKDSLSNLPMQICSEEMYNMMPKLKYINIKNKNVINTDYRMYLVPKHSIMCKIITLAKNKNKSIDLCILDVYGRLYTLMSNISDELAEHINSLSENIGNIGFYKNNKVYTINFDIETREINGILFENAIRKDVDDYAFIGNLGSYINNLDLIYYSPDSKIIYKWTKIVNFIDTTVVLKVTKNIQDFLKSKLKLNYKDGDYVKLTFDLSVTDKVVDKKILSEDDYYLFKDMLGFDKLIYIIDYHNRF